MAKEKMLLPKDKKLKELLKKGGRPGAKEDFLELLRRAAKKKQPSQ